MVVVLPQPLEPRKPKISPRSIRKLTWSTAVKSPKRRVSPSASIATRRRSAARGGIARRGGRAASPRGSSAMKAASRSRARVRAISSAGVPLARTRPASIATSQSKRLRLLHVRGGDQHAHRRPPAADAADQLPELAARQRIDAGGGLVQDQQIGVVDERAAQPELLLHAAGQLAGRAIAKAARARCWRAARRSAAAARPRGWPNRRPKKSTLSKTDSVRVEVAPEALGHVGDAGRDAPPVRGGAHVAAEHLHRAVLDLARAGDQAEQRRLADAVRADEAGHAAGGNVEIDRVERERPCRTGERDAARPRRTGADAAVIAAA